MNFALQKTLELFLIILLGVVLQKKVNAKSGLNGIKTLILSVALPATIFVALLKIELQGSLLIFPLLVLAFNLVMLFSSHYLPGFSEQGVGGTKKRTLMMLLPSLAPGLSCFPFIVVYLGNDSLALAALADVGNKIFVLILLYLLAMHWYRKRTVAQEVVSRKNRFKGLLLAMLNEPINLVIIVALLLLAIGVDMASLPNFLGSTISSLSVMMTPLVLLFIGLAVRIRLKEFGLIFFLLTWRAGIAFCLSAIFLFLVPALAPAMVLLLIVFPQSSCSFWPFAHMSGVSGMEDRDGQKDPTFDIEFAVSVLACSLPFSTLLIIGVFSFSNFFIDPLSLLSVGIGMTFLSYLPKMIKKMLGSKRRDKKRDEIEVFQNVEGFKADPSSSKEWAG
ncbi:MAG: permease [Sediminicola sp.]|tara:strand:+ start:63051 stop:64223 length:1173 start_codon:yes stop_codon:yes gene_type:complete